VFPVPVWFSASWNTPCRNELTTLEARSSTVDCASPPVDEVWAFWDEGGVRGTVPVLLAMVVAMVLICSEVADEPNGLFWRDDSIALTSVLWETPCVEAIWLRLWPLLRSCWICEVDRLSTDANEASMGLVD